MYGGAAVILERDRELAAVAAAAAAAEAGHGAFVMVEGPAGIGKTTLLRAGCDRATGLRILTARGLALERGFPYGVVRQLIEPVRAAAGPGEWDQLLDGAAGLAARVFDGAEAGTVEDDIPYATTHGLYWLAANLAASHPLIIAVDDVHWADTPSLRWLSHLAARVAGLPVALLLATPGGPDEPAMLDELRACPACVRLRLAPLGGDATASLVRARLGATAGPELCQACHVSTGGNPFLLHALAAALSASPGGIPGDEDPWRRVASLGPEQVAQAVQRRVAQLGDGAAKLTRALAVLGGPAPLRHATALAGLEMTQAAGIADRLRAADVFAPGSMLEFAHPIVRTAVYDSIPPSERALAHAGAALLLEREGAGPERLALHLLRSEPCGDPRVTALLRAAAAAARGRGAPGAAAGYLRRALDEPADPAVRPAVLLELGVALAGDRDQAAVPALREAVELAGTASDRAGAALLAARVLGLWGHHDGVMGICRDALHAGGLDPRAADSLEAELFASALLSSASIGDALARARSRLSAPDAPSAWRICDALVAACAAESGGDALARLAPVLATGLGDVSPDSLTAVYVLLVLIWTDELATAKGICDAVLSAARTRGSMSMVAHASCLRAMIMRRLGRLEEAAADGRLALDFKLATSPPLAVAWAASFCVDALTCLGRLDEAEDVAATAAARQPPDGWLHTFMFRQARGALRVAQHRHAEALDDLLAAGAGWQSLGIDNPVIASWRGAAAVAYAALGHGHEARAVAGEQLALAGKTANPATIGIALRAWAAAPPEEHADNSKRRHTAEALAEAVTLLEAGPARYELALALTDYGAHLRRTEQRAAARVPLKRALDLAQRTGACHLAEQARRELLAAGARPRRAAITGPDALTSAETRVAVLATQGLSNRQIAEHLFITQATVETHLRHAFGKLGIASRDGLAAQLANRTEADADADAEAEAER